MEKEKKETKHKISFISINNKEVPVVSINYGKQQDWLKYGDDNLYPQTLTNLLQSSVHNSIVNLKLAYTVGDGLIHDDTPELVNFLENLNPEYDANELLKRTALDLIVFGGFSWQIIWNKLGDRILSISHMPYEKLRVEYPDDFGNYNFLYFCRDWVHEGAQKSKAIRLPKFKKQGEDVSLPQIYYYSENNKLIDYYGVPDYFGAINAIETDVLLSRFDRANVDNSFIPSFMLILPEGLTEEQAKEIKKEIEKNYKGVENAGKGMMVAGSTDADGKAINPQFVPLSNENNADIYDTTDKRITQKIITGHRLNSPTLAGLAGVGGLGGNASEIATASEFFRNSIIVDYQKTILSHFCKILKINGLEPEQLEFSYSAPVQHVFSESLLQQILTTNELREATGYEAMELDELVDEIADTDNPDEAAQQGFRKGKNIIKK